MFSRIIVGHDHHGGGQDAVAFARLLADATDAELIVAGVIAMGPVPVETETMYRFKSRGFNAAISQRAAAAGADSRIVHSHSVACGLSDLAEDFEADLIVLGSSRRGPVGRILAGSIALQLLHGAPCAVAVAPVDYAADPPPRLESIVVGVDGAAESQAAAGAAADIAAATGASVRLVAVEQLGADIHKYLRRNLERAKAAFPAGTQAVEEIVAGEPAQKLRELSENASLLMLGSRGFGPFGRVVLGSTDAKLLRAADCPVLVWPRQAGTRTSSVRSPEPVAG